MEVYQFSDYRRYLRSVLEKRCQQNPRYSLRAFARDLGLTPSYLSEVINGKRNLTLNQAGRFSENLLFTDKEMNYFSDLIQVEHSKSEKIRSIATRRISKIRDQSKFSEVELDAFNVISDWYHSAILELTETKEWKSDPKWIAKRLGISVIEASEGLSRLIRVGILAEVEGIVKKSKAKFKVGKDTPSTAIRSHHKQILAKANVALEEQGLNEREFGSLTIAVPSDKIDDYKKLIREFKNNLHSLNEGQDCDEVYTLGIQFFRISSHVNSKATTSNRTKKGPVTRNV